MRKYTVLHTIETGGPGGAETVLLNLATCLDSSRFRSLVLLPERGWLYARLQEAAVPTFVVRSRAWYDSGLLRRMARLIHDEKVDVIHSHLPDQNFYSCLAGMLTRRKVVVTYHGTQTLSAAGDLKSAFKLWLVRGAADAVVVVSDHLQSMLREVGFSQEKLFRIYNGIDCQRFAAPPEGRVRAELRCTNGAKLVGMVANVRESKGYNYFVRAARLIADAIPHARFVAIGEMNDSRYDDLRSLVAELQLEERFSFLGFRPDIPQVLADLDVFTLSSVSEGFSLATIEAMAAGTPVVVTRSGGPEEIVEDGRTGLLVAPADPSSLAARVCELLSNRELACTLAREARAVVQERFALAKMVSEYETVYQRCLRAA